MIRGEGIEWLHFINFPSSNLKSTLILESFEKADRFLSQYGVLIMRIGSRDRLAEKGDVKRIRQVQRERINQVVTGQTFHPGKKFPGKLVIVLIEIIFCCGRHGRRKARRCFRE